MQRFNPGSAIRAGILGTIAITITLFLTGTNIVAMLGQMLTGSSGPAAYAAGGIVHLAIGTIFALIFAGVIEPIVRAPRFVEGLALGVFAFAMAMVAMPLMAAMLSPGSAGGAAGNPCAAVATRNPSREDAASNPCAKANPCAAAGQNPCAKANPCAAAGQNPCAKANPCAAAANPCARAGGAGSSVAQPLMSLVNHLIFGAVVGLTYRPRYAAA